ncbi:hypothetical protein KAI87_04815 [Myxococcota bacterium]|nr:hypothetical protein [Myxococcota bacterium]
MKFFQTKNIKTGSAATLFVALILSTLIASCSSGGSTLSGGGRPEEQEWDISAINIDTMGENDNEKRRVLYMTFGEASARLGSFRFEATSYFNFDRGKTTYDQSDHYLLERDGLGNMHGRLVTPQNETEYYLIGETLYVRQDMGHLRHKKRQDSEATFWPELIFASLGESVELFSQGLILENPNATLFDNRQTTRFQLRVDSLSKTNLGKIDRKKRSLPIAPTSHWRTLAKPLDLTGHLWVDNQNGVPIKIKMEGRLDISDRAVRQTELKVKFEAAISEIGAVKPIEAPKNRAEYTRKRKPRNLLNFFKHKLPPPPEEADTKDNK